MLKQNLIASYGTQAYVSLIGLVVMPFFLRHMGADAFGLIGIFWFLQSTLQLLDLGLTPTVSRQVSRFHAGAASVVEADLALTGAAWLFGVLSIALIAVFGFAGQWIATNWLGESRLPHDEIATCLSAMVVAASVRWVGGLYRAALVGLELQSQVNAAVAVFATLRFVGPMFVVLLISPSPRVFFAYQIVASILELVATRTLLRWNAPELFRLRGFPPRLRQLRGLAPMAGAMAFVSAAWIFQTQVDKLVLSKLLSLAEYGHFTLAVMVSGGVLMLIPPLNQVLQPRLTIMAAHGDHDRIRELYSLATQCAAAMFGALGITIAVFAQPLLLLWTADASAAAAAAPTLFWYGLANAVTGVLVLPFTLQFARGYLRLQVVGVAIFATLQLPMLLVLASRHGGVGAGIALLASNLAFLLLWVPLAHRRLLERPAWRWLVRDILPAVAVITPTVYLASRATAGIDGRWQLGMVIALVFAVALGLGLLAGRRSRASVLAVLWKA